MVEGEHNPEQSWVISAKDLALGEYDPTLLVDSVDNTNSPYDNPGSRHYPTPEEIAKFEDNDRGIWEG